MMTAHVMSTNSATQKYLVEFLDEYTYTIGSHHHSRHAQFWTD